MGKYNFPDLHLISCHKIPERSFFYKEKQFPVCARCTGIYAGFLTAPLFLFNVIELSWVWTILLILPTIIDGLTQALFKRESNNILRVTTGFMYGTGLMSAASLIGKSIVFYLGI